MKAGDAFPDAVSTLKPWLSSVRRGDVTLHQFRETGLAKRFPEDALTFLDTSPIHIPNQAMASNYNGRCRPAEVLVDGASHRLIRRRETIDDLLALEKNPAEAPDLAKDVAAAGRKRKYAIATSSKLCTINSDGE
jgi:hypothetical protein